MEEKGISHPAISGNALRKNGFSFRRIEEIIKNGMPKELEEIKDFYYELPLPGSISLNNMKIEAKITFPPSSLKTPKNIALFDYSLLQPPIFIRNIKEGDRFIPYGCNYEKKVARFFITEKIKKEIRREIPILFDKDGVLWIVGLRRSNRAIVTEKTKDVLMIELK